MSNELKIEAGKLYKTRDGQTAKIYAIHDRGTYPIHGAIYDIDSNEWGACAWTAEGNYLIDRECGGDIVAEWTDEDEQALQNG